MEIFFHFFTLQTDNFYNNNCLVILYQEMDNMQVDNLKKKKTLLFSATHT